MEGGWIKLHRKIMDWEWWGIPEMFILWVYLIFSANLEDKEWKGMKIPRGSFVTGRKRIAEACGISEQQVRTCLARLENSQQITIKSTNKYSIITICKYDDYQVNEKDEQPAEQPIDNQQSTNNQPQLKNGRIYNTCVLDKTPARTRTREDWRFISSVRQSLLGFDKNRIAEFKKDLFRAEVEELNEKVGMILEQKEAFIAWWTESSPNSDKIKAEYEVTFDTENRMRIWVDRQKPSQRIQQPKSRMDQLEDDLKYINNFFYGQQQQNSAPDEQ